MTIEATTALITGGARGIGYAIARELAGSGVEVTLIDVDGTALEEAVSNLQASRAPISGIKSDVADPRGISSAVEQAYEAMGSVDILVNNAGIAGPTAPIPSVTRHEFNQVIEINLTAPFEFTKAVMPGMIENEFGRIINISSSSAKLKVPNRVAYAASKAGLLGLTRTTAIEGGPYNVNANAVCPGTVMGPRMDAVIQREAEVEGISADVIRENKEDMSPRGEMVRARDVAALVAFLCTSGADRITGQSLNVSAGKTTH